MLRAAALALCAVPFAAQAHCISFGGRDCVPGHRLGREFFDVVSKSYACLDTYHVSPDGIWAPNGKAPPDKLPAFISAHRDEAVGLYETVAATCLATTLGHRAVHALSALQSELARDALQRLWHETRSYDRIIVVRAMLEDPAFWDDERFDALWKNELDARVRQSIAAAVRLRHDARSLPVIERWLPAETDPETRRALEMARELIESPGKCLLTSSDRSLRLGARCTYSCSGAVDTPNDAWLTWHLFFCDEHRSAAELLRAQSHEAQRVEAHLPWWRAAMAAGVLLLALVVPIALRFRRA